MVGEPPGEGAFFGEGPIDDDEPHLAAGRRASTVNHSDRGSLTFSPRAATATTS